MLSLFTSKQKEGIWQIAQTDENKCCEKLGFMSTW